MVAGNTFQRFEIKYLVNNRIRCILENEFSGRMIPDEYGVSTICNVYYDTPDYRLIRKSLDKPVYKEKLRHRSYGQVNGTDKTYIELKKKYKGIVYKRRISMPHDEAVRYLGNAIGMSEDSQIARELDYFKNFYIDLKPAVYLCYDRIAYFSEEDKNLRITFDDNIRWRRDRMLLTEKPGGNPLLEEGMSLMEIKTAGAMPLWLVDILSEERIRKTSFSKYGMAYMTFCSKKLNQDIVNDVCEKYVCNL